MLTRTRTDRVPAHTNNLGVDAIVPFSGTDRERSPSNCPKLHASVTDVCYSGIARRKRRCRILEPLTCVTRGRGAPASTHKDGARKEGRLARQCVELERVVAVGIIVLWFWCPPICAPGMQTNLLPGPFPFFLCVLFSAPEKKIFLALYDRIRCVVSHTVAFPPVFFCCFHRVDVSSPLFFSCPSIKSTPERIGAKTGLSQRLYLFAFCRSQNFASPRGRSVGRSVGPVKFRILPFFF